jgi:hypothetical protein
VSDDDAAKPRGYDSLREALTAIIKHEEAKRREEDSQANRLKNNPLKNS